MNIPLDTELPCLGSWDLYDTLIEGRSGNEGMRATVALCRDICAVCPVKDQCWTENADEDWVKRLSRPEHLVERACEWCSALMVVYPRGRQKRFCSGRCTDSAYRKKKAAA